MSAWKAERISLPQSPNADSCAPKSSIVAEALLLVALGLLAISPPAVATPARSQETFIKGAACYGEEVDVDLADPDGVPRVGLTVPLAVGYVSVYPFGDGLLDPLKDCQEQPILARSVFLSLGHRTIPELGLTSQELTFHRIEFHYGGFQPLALGKEMRDAAAFQDIADGKSIVMPNGFIKLRPTPSGAGTYVLLSSDRSVVIYTSCGAMVDDVECSVADRNDLGVGFTYWFKYSKIDQSRWLDLNAAAKRFATALIR